MKLKTCRLTEGFRVAFAHRGVQAAEMVIAPGDSEGGPDNFHRHSDQWLFVLAGAGLAIVEGKRRPLRNGSLLLIEHGERHEIRNTGRKLLVTLNLYSPLAYSQKGSLLTTGKPAGSGWSARAMPSHGPHHHACEAPIDLIYVNPPSSHRLSLARSQRTCGDAA